MHRVGGFLNWIGGGLSRVTASSLVIAFVLVVFGMTPPELIVYLATSTPPWLLNGWTKLIILIAGLVLIAISLRFNIWSRKQLAIDDLAEDISWVIANILNHKTIRMENDEKKVDEFELAYQNWCNKVSKKLENRAFFTRADQLHFDRLGFVPEFLMAHDGKVNHVLEMLSLKLERLRDIINWSQQRRR